MDPTDEENRRSDPALSRLTQQPGVQKMVPMQIWMGLTLAQQQTVIQILIQVGRCLTQTWEEADNEPV